MQQNQAFIKKDQKQLYLFRTTQVPFLLDSIIENRVLLIANASSDNHCITSEAALKLWWNKLLRNASI